VVPYSFYFISMGNSAQQNAITWALVITLQPEVVSFLLKVVLSKLLLIRVKQSNNF
jgi:hypothetical protein